MESIYFELLVYKPLYKIHFYLICQSGRPCGMIGIGLAAPEWQLDKNGLLGLVHNTHVIHINVEEATSLLLLQM